MPPHDRVFHQKESIGGSVEAELHRASPVTLQRPAGPVITVMMVHGGWFEILRFSNGTFAVPHLLEVIQYCYFIVLWLYRARVAVTACLFTTSSITLQRWRSGQRLETEQNGTFFERFNSRKDLKHHIISLEMSVLHFSPKRDSTRLLDSAVSFQIPVRPSVRPSTRVDPPVVFFYRICVD